MTQRLAEFMHVFRFSSVVAGLLSPLEVSTSARDWVKQHALPQMLNPWDICPAFGCQKIQK